MWKSSIHPVLNFHTALVYKLSLSFSFECIRSGLKLCLSCIPGHIPAAITMGILALGGLHSKLLGSTQYAIPDLVNLSPAVTWAHYTVSSSP